MTRVKEFTAIAYEGLGPEAMAALGGRTLLAPTQRLDDQVNEWARGSGVRIISASPPTMWREYVDETRRCVLSITKCLILYRPPEIAPPADAAT